VTVTAHTSPFAFAPTVRQPARGTQVEIDVAARQVVRHGREVPLTRLEFDLLVFLARHPRRVFTRDQLLRNVWGYEIAGPRTVDVHITRLRGKLDVPVVRTIYGVGYRLADDAGVTLTAED
jgi:two-component system OmpR family response regulator